MKKKLIVLSGLGLALTPLWVFAQNTSPCASGTIVTGIPSLICKISEILGYVIPVLVVLGVVYFVWGVIQYVISDDEEAKSTGRMRMIWGIVGLVVIVGMWGLVRIVTNTFNLDNNTGGIVLPRVPGQ